MARHRSALVLVPALLLVATAPQAQQGQQQYPVMNRLAEKIVQKYQTTPCEQIAAMKNEPQQGEEAAMKQRVIQMLKQDPQMRQAFIDKVAAPIANKLFECGMIP